MCLEGASTHAEWRQDLGQRTVQTMPCDGQDMVSGSHLHGPSSKLFDLILRTHKKKIGTSD